MQTDAGWDGDPGRLTNAAVTDCSPVLQPSDVAGGLVGGDLRSDVMPAALIDRLLHHSPIVNARGNGYRMREYRAR